MRSKNKSGLGLQVAIVDEDARSTRLLRTLLEAENYRCFSFSRYSELEPAIGALEIKAVLLDLATPTLARIETIRRIRAASAVPILVVSAITNEADTVSALDAGADDFLAKPVVAGEFLARVRVALRHGRARACSSSDRIQIGDLSVNLLSREVTLGGAPLSLTRTDYKLLAFLARNRGRVVAHERLLLEGWGPNARDSHYLRVYMARLRRKFESRATGLRYIVTEARVGYRLLSKPEARER
jgi:two-component system KDP operon response regulator KdpE